MGISKRSCLVFSVFLATSMVIGAVGPKEFDGRMIIRDIDDNPQHPRWLPEGNRLETENGNTHLYGVRWVVFPNKPKTPRKLEVSLVAVTTFRGVASN